MSKHLDLDFVIADCAGNRASMQRRVDKAIAYAEERVFRVACEMLRSKELEASRWIETVKTIQAGESIKAKDGQYYADWLEPKRKELK